MLLLRKLSLSMRLSVGGLGRHHGWRVIMSDATMWRHLSLWYRMEHATDQVSVTGVTNIHI